MKYDLIVVGAGPAGSITAKTVAQAGYDVLILERDAFCRSPCAGYVSSTINVELLQQNLPEMWVTFKEYWQ
jgi:flavin-dependent dehydrogenase